MTEIVSRTELLAAVVAERFPDPAAIRRERPDTPAETAARRRVLAAAFRDAPRQHRPPARIAKRRAA